MHSIGLISTFFAVVALVSSGPIDPSVDSYDPASDGGELAYVEAVNPDLDNVASGDDPASPDLLAAATKPKKPKPTLGSKKSGQRRLGAPPGTTRPGTPGTPGQRRLPGSGGPTRTRPNPTEENFSGQGDSRGRRPRPNSDQDNSGQGDSRGRPPGPNPEQDNSGQGNSRGRPSGQNSDQGDPQQGVTQDSVYDGRPSSQGLQGCEKYDCPYKCYNNCPCWEYCKSGFCQDDLGIQDEPSVNWHVTCGNGPTSLQQMCHDYCWNHCPDIKKTDRQLDNYYCDQFHASNDLGGEIVFTPIDGGVPTTNDVSSIDSSIFNGGVASNDPDALNDEVLSDNNVDAPPANDGNIADDNPDPTDDLD